MKNSKLSWSLVSKEDLLDIFLGEFSIINNSSRLPIRDVKEGKLTIGFTSDGSLFAGGNPHLLVLEDHLLSETMSWLRVYSAEMSPLSQFVRVVLRSDLDVFELAAEREWKHSYHQSERWASIAVGETLALAEGELDLRTMALSRLSYSFSLPIGRTSFNFNSEKSTRTCANRLRKIESEQRFGRRSISVEQLTPIWALAYSNLLGRVSADEAVEIVLEYSAKYYNSYKNINQHFEIKSLANFNGLKSNSTEERVMAFNHLVSEVTNRLSQGNIEGYAPILAAAAWMVGRGTSHVFLLKRIGKIIPISYVWFGLIAALCGPRGWDSAWIRTVKGAERLLKYEFNWTEVSNTDISWPEFSWLIDTFENLEQINSLPKMLPRTLAVEIVPGASVHLRLAGTVAEQENRPTEIQSEKESNLRNALSQFMYLADKFKDLIEPNIHEKYTVRTNQNELKQKSTEKKTRSIRTSRGPKI